MSDSHSKALHIRGLAKTYDTVSGEQVNALQPTSLEIGAGEFVTIVGPSGCGKVFVIFIATFFPTVLATVAGVKGVDPVLVRAGQVLGCRDETTIFRKIILPAALPSIVVGLRISFGTGWAAIIAAELVAAQSGLGYLIADGMEILRADLVLVGMVAIGIIGVVFDTIFRAIHRRYG